MEINEPIRALQPQNLQHEGLNDSNRFESLNGNTPYIKQQVFVSKLLSAPLKYLQR